MNLFKKFRKKCALKEFKTEIKKRYTYHFLSNATLIIFLKTSHKTFFR